MTKALDDAKAGDKLILNGYGKSVVTVTNITKTQIHIKDTRYRKSDGYLIGNKSIWNNQYLGLYDEQIAAKIKYKHLYGKVNEIIDQEKDNLSITQLQRILIILKEKEFT